MFLWEYTFSLCCAIYLFIDILWKKWYLMITFRNFLISGILVYIYEVGWILMFFLFVILVKVNNNEKESKTITICHVSAHKLLEKCWTCWNNHYLFISLLDKCQIRSNRIKNIISISSMENLIGTIISTRAVHFAYLKIISSKVHGNNLLANSLTSGLVHKLVTVCLHSSLLRKPQYNCERNVEEFNSHHYTVQIRKT